MVTVSGGAGVLERVVNRADNVCSVDCKASEDSAKTWSVDPAWTYDDHYQPDSIFQRKLTKLPPPKCKGTEYAVAWLTV